jgi:2,4'-dihydroxyacetophenone dioxygenase
MRTGLRADSAARAGRGPTRPGKSFRPLRFAADGWSGLMRLEPGSAGAVHYHTGAVDAFNLADARKIFGTGERVGPGNYVYEAAGTVDGWRAIGDEPCVVLIKVIGVIDYLGGDGQVIESVTAETQRALYLAWCREQDVRPAGQILG